MYTRKPNIFLLLSTALLALTALPVLAQFPGGPSYAKVHTVATPGQFKRGGKADVVVTVVLNPGFHINAAKPADENLIPTKLTLTAPAGMKLGTIVYPPNQVLKAPALSDKPLLVYIGTARIRVPVTDVSAKPGRYTLSGSIQYQGCNANSCLPPKTDAVTATITVL